MSAEGLNTDERPLPVSGGWQCHSMQGFILLAAQRGVGGPWQVPTALRSATSTGCISLAVDLAQAFQRETGYSASASALTGSVDEKLQLARFLAQGGSTAAVLLMDAKLLGPIWPTCDWETPLLRARNCLADEGTKFFVALATPAGRGGFGAALSHARTTFLARRVEQFCNRDGLGFLGTVDSAPATVSKLHPSPFHERVATVLAHRLASATFFCCDAFRTIGGSVSNLSELRG
ncbi:hypothetical protein AWB81_07401 [Caballeronia arationis]|uniref:hypothetical protein n=1 Tax=Caballeronia arationis TaxID=1777142 RepID=UPI00074C18A5|nr:hypothetical protein [Caballeronia arationis]SAL06006.1 hypothetical protein AWB81_07401 [Caballeronia arationis]